LSVDQGEDYEVGDIEVKEARERKNGLVVTGESWRAEEKRKREQQGHCYRTICT
jgi:hypothetical protein